MSNMEFLRPSYFNTITMATATTGDSTLKYLMDRKVTNKWKSVGDNSDLTTTTIRIEFTGTQNIDKIVLQSINWKEFKIYHSSNTANLFSLTSSGTGTSSWNANSATNMILNLAATCSCSIVTIEATKTMTANQEKECGELWISEKLLKFEINPSSKDYKPKMDRKSYEHEMSDGGVATYIIQENFNGTITRTNVSSSEYSALWTIYTLYTPFVFIPNPTETSWDAKIYEVNWTGDFSFEAYTDNYRGNGYSGQMTLRETPK